MLLSVFLVAAVQAAPPATIWTPRGPVEMGRVTHHAPERQAVQAIIAKAACWTSGVELAEQRTSAASPKVKVLGDLPPANHTLTVLRTVDGCPVSSTVRYNVDRPARR
jgi:hypothetical protein